MVNAATLGVDDMDVERSIEVLDFTSWANTPSGGEQQQDFYTPSFNNPFFDEYHLFHPRGGSDTVDYY